MPRGRITKRVKPYFVFLLALETGMLGVFSALDMFLFYLFWEATLVPMYFLIGMWGYGRRIYAAMKFFLFTLVGSLLMLVGHPLPVLRRAMALPRSTTRRLLGTPLSIWDATVALPRLLRVVRRQGPARSVPYVAARRAYRGADGGLGDAGGRAAEDGRLRADPVRDPLFPDAAREFVPLIMGLAIVGIVYGALVAMMQKDLKRLIAYSSVAHLGFVVLGMFVGTVQGMSGGILQMVNHGLSTGALFMLVGLLYDRRHTRLIADFGGLASRADPGRGLPVGRAVVARSAGPQRLRRRVPGPARNVFLPLVGRSGRFGIVLAAIYLLWAYQRVFHGPVTHEENRTLPDLNVREIAMLAPFSPSSSSSASTRSPSSNASSRRPRRWFDN